MKRFWNSLVRPMLDAGEPRRLIEVGSLRGDNTALLLGYCREHDAVLHVIDPLPQFDVAAWQAEFGEHFQFHQAKSLEVLRDLPPADLVLIDGDHNWYTVYHELKQIAEAAARAERPYPVVLFHDIGWPYARRDLYYDPTDIPPDFRQAYEQQGIVPGSSALQATGLNTKLRNATHEGGPRNGVLTAVEDFMAEHPEPLRLLLIDGFHGLGVLYPASLATWSPGLAAHLDQLTAAVTLLGAHLHNLDQQMIQSRLRTIRLRRRLAKAEGQPEPEEPDDA